MFKLQSMARHEVIVKQNFKIFYWTLTVVLIFLKMYGQYGVSKDYGNK